MTHIDKTTFDAIVRLIEPYLRDATARQQHIQVIFTGTDDELPRIDYTGASMTVSERMVFALAQYGKRKLWHLLKWGIYDMVGYEQQQQIDTWESLLNVDTLTLHGDIPQPEKPPPTTNINIVGNVAGGNVNIGGNQTFQGNVTFTQTTVQKIRACPTAPKPPAHFSGRREELNRLRQTLSQGTSVAITGIQGMGGIGKTALAQQLAQEMTNFSAVLWASLGQQPISVNLLTHWARHADPDFDPGQDDIETLAYRVQALLTNLINEMCPGQVLIILDDIWEESVGTARLLQKAAPANSVSLITTRSQKVVAQLRSTRFELKPMQPQEALLMMRKLLADYAAIPDDTLTKLARTVGFHPLAMELAAGQVTLLERPVQEIDNVITELERGIPAGSPFRDIHLELGEAREDNLELVLSFSYNNLSQVEQAQFRQLGILAYGSSFDTGICKSIWSTEPKSALDALRHRAMLGIAEDVGWYQQHSLLRAYARALLIQSEEIEVTFRRYVEHITKLSEIFHEKRDNPEEWDNMTPYQPHIHHIGDALVQHYKATNEIWTEFTLEFVYQTYTYLARRPETLFEEVDGTRQPVRLQWLEIGLVASRQQSIRRHELLFLVALGLIHNKFGNRKQALDYYLLSLEICHEIDDKTEEATILNNIGLVWSNLGDKHKALDYYEQALSLRRAVGNKTEEATILNNIGLVWSALGDKHKALDYYEQALPLRRAVGNKTDEAATLTNIGRVWSDLGDKHKALDYYEQALPLKRAVGDKIGEAIILNNIGGVWFAWGEQHEALNYYEQALPLGREVGDKAGVGTTFNNIGRVWSALGEEHKALNYYEQALPLRREVGDKAGEAATLNNIGGVWFAWGEQHKALNYYEQALSLYNAVGDKAGEAATLNNIGRVWSALGEQHKALNYYEQALPLFNAVGDKVGEATALNNIGLEWSALGEQHKALNYYEQALPLFNAVGDKVGEATALNNIGRVWSALGEQHKALNYYEQSLPLRRAVDDKVGESITCFNIGIIYADEGNFDEAIRYIERCVELDEIVKHPDLESDRQYLIDLKSKRDRATLPDDDMQEAIAAMVQIYQQGGEVALYQMLQEAGVGDKIIHTLVQQIKDYADE